MSTDFFCDISVELACIPVYCTDMAELNTESLTDEVYRTLLNRFLNSEIVPGNVLDRKRIAEELNVSMAPVRDALIRLGMEGFVDTLPRKGTIAKAVNRDDLYGSLMIREAIECQAARMYCGQPISENHTMLLEYARRADDFTQGFVEHWKLDVAFHEQLLQLTGCRTFVEEYNRFMKVATFHHVNRFLTNDDLRERRSHVELLDELTTRDPDRAEAVIRDHLKSGKRTFF